MRKPTQHDVARLAGVSYATVDRVLNGRGGVADKSALRVREAVEELGYERDLHAANLSRGRIYRFRFVLPHGDHSFFRALHRAVAVEAMRRRADRMAISVHEIAALDPVAVVRALEGTPPDCDCVAVVATESEEIAAAIEALASAGTKVVTLVGDAAPHSRAAYIGIDNVVAGRTVGRLLRMAHIGRPARILPVLGALSARDHRERLEGARKVLEGEGPALALLPPVVAGDRSGLVRERVAEAMARHPDLTGIYSIGAGNRGLIELLRSHEGPRPFVVMHELTPATRGALEEGLVDAVIDQKPAREVALAIDVMKALADGRAPSGPSHEVTPAIYLRDNLPEAGKSGDES